MNAEVRCPQNLGDLNNRQLRKLAKDTWESYGGCASETIGQPSLPTSSEHEHMKTGVRRIYADVASVYIKSGMSRKVIEAAFFAARAIVLREKRKK